MTQEPQRARVASSGPGRPLGARVTINAPRGATGYAAPAPPASGRNPSVRPPAGPASGWSVLSKEMNLEALVRSIVREAVREEIRPLREELRAVAEAVRDRREVQGTHGSEFLTVEEIATNLKVSPATVRTWIAAGALRSIRPGVAGRDGRVYRIARSHLDSFLATKQKGSRDDADITAEAARILANVARKRKAVT